MVGATAWTFWRTPSTMQRTSLWLKPSRKRAVGLPKSTPATVFDIPNLPVIGQDLVAGTVQGISAFDVDLGLLPTSDFPTGYPFLPVLNPDLTLD